ncbi:F-box/LRR-repeat protein At5g63520-like isoform X1 [Castanea sativa]|uniref:F-box/LRR-repeat protein At5g63520-like isoform X1 n=1 Tax=Castanea sativa TaxID=21020 RepID=UPI003F64FCCD
MSEAESSSKIKTHRTTTTTGLSSSSLFTLLNDDVLQNILARLPALSFASATCVSKLWNTVCNRVLSRPKFASALSLDRCPFGAVEDVLDKVLSEPIRPHFVIASIARGFELPETFGPIVRTFKRTPIVVSIANGLIGRDAFTNEFREANWGTTEGDSDDEYGSNIEDTNHGIVLTVGYVPGLKVDAIPLLGNPWEPQVAMTDKFVKDIKKYTASVSGCTSPVGIIMFGERLVDLKTHIDVLDYAMPKETVIVGDERGRFRYNSRGFCGNGYCEDAVALVFARDRHKSSGIGDIQFRVALSNGVSAIGPKYKVASVTLDGPNSPRRTTSTWLTARREGDGDILNGQTMLADIRNELDYHYELYPLYIGVTKQRNYCIRSKEKTITSLAFHRVRGGGESDLYVDGFNIKTGDYFQFYRSDRKNASVNLKSLKQDGSSNNCHHKRAVPVNIKKEVFGGFIFSCCGRSDSFFKRRNDVISPFKKNFPGVPLAGVFCSGEIVRGSSSLIEESNKEKSSHCCLHVGSTVYLVMSYTCPEC